jgi:hypothetical protein
MCEKVKIYITAQQTIHIKLSMDCCVGDIILLRLLYSTHYISA